MNETRDTKDIEGIYSTIVENSDNKVWKDGDCPEALGDSEYALKHAEGTGALGAHDKGDLAAGFGQPVTPEGTDDQNAFYMKKISERLKESEKKSGKSVNEEINNFETMSKNNPDNIFDKLYSTIMEGDDPFADLDAGMPEDGEDLGDEELGLDDGGDEVTLNLPRDLAEQLMDALQGQLDGGDEDEFGDEEAGDEAGDEFGDDEMLGDAVVSEPAPKPHGGGDRQHKDAGNTGSGSNKVSSSKTGSSDGGHADGSASGDDPSPKPLGKGGDRSHPDAGRTGSGSNKVKNTSKAIGD